MNRLLSSLLFTFFISSCANSQSHNNPKLVGGPCEGCEAVFEFGDQKLNSTDTLPDFQKVGTPIKVEGTIYQPDGKTPANGVILYAYHTNIEGVYKPGKDPEGWEKQHGYNRGWLKTDESGQYSFYTIRPASYPNSTEPAHIHYTVLEPNGKYYWLSSCHFEGGKHLTSSETNPKNPRGGTSGLLSLKKENGVWVGTRDIVLGKNIPGYE